MSREKEHQENKIKGNCRRCGADRNSEKYISCMNQYCDQKPMEVIF